jgi:hypothetical protein
MRPSESEVESYLQDSGFYDFVGVTPAKRTHNHTTADVVTIRRETSSKAVEPRESEIRTLLERHASLTDEEIELFDSKVLTEVFLNVIEHGVSVGENRWRGAEQGWWVIAQYHPTHRFMSVCIADNGIGIRHTLLTGPQSADITNDLGAAASDDQFIKLALERKVSGAIDANIMNKPLFREARYRRGAHRGNGLSRIRETCRELGIPFSLISQHGFVGVSAEGSIGRVTASPNRVFAGTLYHFVIPAQENRDETR